MNSIFGKPNEGIHAYRMPGDLAMVDVAATLYGAYYVGKYLKVQYWQAAALSFGAGILAHRVFGVRTKIDKVLFPDAGYEFW